MATASNIVVATAAKQFRGVFDELWNVTFAIDSTSIGSNSVVQESITVPGVRRATDVVLGWTHSAEPAAGLMEFLHVGADDTLHLQRHNSNAGPADPAASTFRVVIARMI